MADLAKFWKGCRKTVKEPGARILELLHGNALGVRGRIRVRKTRCLAWIMPAVS